MEIELLLSDLGAKAVDVAASVAEALALIAGNAYEFALLDVNLGGETSRHAADALAASGVPHVFATGYGILPWDAPGQVRMPVLIKPFDAFDLRKAVVTAQALAAR